MSTVSHVIVKKGAGNGSFTSSLLIACVYLYCVTVFGNQPTKDSNGDWNLNKKLYLLMLSQAALCEC